MPFGWDGTLRLGSSLRCLLVVVCMSVTAACASGDGGAVPAPIAAYQADPTKSIYYQTSVGMRRAPPLHERGIENLGLLYAPAPALHLDYVGITVFENRHDEIGAEKFVPPAFAKGLFLERINASPHVSVASIDGEYASLLDQIEQSWSTSEYYLADAGMSRLADLRRIGFDAILVVRERLLPDFISNRDWATLGPLGLYRRPFWEVQAYGGFEFFLIDTTTGKEIKNTRFLQISMAPVAGVKDVSAPELYTQVERSAISYALEARISNNVTLALRLLKIIPGEDGEYLTYDPEVENPPGLYPE